jgi:hypothetical protein
VSEINYNYGLKSPYLINVTVLKSGPSGTILPGGVQSVKQSEDITIEIQETCPVPRLSQVLVDNVALNLAVPTTTLFDGTQVHVNGKVITLKNVQSPHTVEAKFMSNSVPGSAYCWTDENGCQDGSFEYYYFDNCGQQGYKYRVWDIQGVPADLQHLIPLEGCPVTTGQNCNPIQQQ